MPKQPENDMDRFNAVIRTFLATSILFAVEKTLFTMEEREKIATCLTDIRDVLQGVEHRLTQPQAIPDTNIVEFPRFPHAKDSQ